MKVSDSPTPTSRFVYYAVAAIVVAALAGWFLLPKNEVGNPLTGPINPPNEITQLESDTAIAEPFQRVHVAPVICTIKANVDTVLTLAGGTSIEIPAGIFVNDQNEPVLQPVEIRFREFHSAADVITSGIPMEAVPGNGRDDVFETAGMFEIKGYADGQPVKIAEGKSMTVNLRSDAQGDYDFWKYNPQTSSWINQAPGNKVNVRPSETAPTPDAASTKTSKVSPQIPTAPANLATDGRTPLQLKGLPMDVSQCPDLSQKNTQLILLYAGKNAKAAESKVLKQMSAFRWRKSKLNPTSDPNLYNLVVEGDTTLRLPVTVAFSGQEFKAKQKAYEDLLADYNRGAIQRQYVEKLEERQAAFTRSMAIKGFGLYNHDRYYSQPDVMQVAAAFDFGETISPKLRAKIVVYLIAGNDRAVVQYPSYYWEAIRFSRADRNSLLAVLPDGRVATFSQSDFKRARNEMAQSTPQQPFLFKMKLQTEPVASVNDLQETIQRIAI